jgi:hypothetical protein
MMTFVVVLCSLLSNDKRKTSREKEATVVGAVAVAVVVDVVSSFSLIMPAALSQPST